MNAFVPKSLAMTRTSGCSKALKDHVHGLERSTIDSQWGGISMIALLDRPARHSLRPFNPKGTHCRV